MLVWACITVSTGAMGKGFWDSRIEVNGIEMEHRARSRWGSPDTEQPKEVGQEAIATLDVMPRRKARHGMSQESMGAKQQFIHQKKKKLKK